MKLYIKLFLNLLFVLVLVTLQIAFVSSLPGWLNKINLIIIFIIFILEIFDLKAAITWSLLCGLILEIFSFSPPGTYFISLMIMTWSTNYLLHSFFTDRSLYSFLVLTLFSFVCYEFSVYTIEYLINFVSRTDYNLLINNDFLIVKLKSLIINCIAVLFAFYFLGFATNKLKPVFLVKRKI